MSTKTVEGHLTPSFEINLCTACQSFWFDKYEDLKLAPRSTLELLKFIGEHSPSDRTPLAQALHCPRCSGQLQMTHDLQRSTRFNYWRCDEHGRFMGFFDFLKEKNFIRQLTPQQIDELRQSVQQVNCSNCGGPIDLAKSSNCEHCGSPISILDTKQSQELLKQLQLAAEPKPIDPALPLELELVKLRMNRLFGIQNPNDDA